MNRIGFDGRWFIAISLFVYVFLLFSVQFFTGDYAAWWYKWVGIRALDIFFADLDVVATACDSIRLGYDPLGNNVVHPVHCPLNYPRIWQTIVYTGFSPKHVVFVGICMVFSFLYASFHLIGKLNVTEWKKVIYYILVFCSSNVVLLMVRANVDIVIFLLIFFAVIFSQRQVIALSILLFSAILKLYPIICSWVWLNKSFKSWQVFGIVFTVFAAYIYFTFDDVVLISDLTPRSTWFSYGMYVLTSNLSVKSAWTLNWVIAKVIPAFLAFAIIVCAFYLAYTRPFVFYSEKLDKNEVSFLLGASVYCGTFLIGNNYDYRLAFLIFTIPQLFVWLENYQNRKEVKLVFFLILFLLWNNSFLAWGRLVHNVGKQAMYLTEEIVSWVLFFFLVKYALYRFINLFFQKKSVV